jgi:uncharacterized protein (TIGR02145 family)
MTMMAQNGKISYQAVVRDSENHLVYDTPLQVTIALANSETGAAVYSEQHAVTSNANGLISLLIGDGQNKQGHWEDVHWNTTWVTATIRKASDQTFLAEHHLPLSAVPYALYADFADSMNLAVLQDYLDEHHYVTEDELPAVQANADWTETNPDTASYIKNKPDLNDYEKKAELCGDVKDCIKDTLKYYTTTNKIDTLLGAYYDTTRTKSVISDTATALRAMMGEAAYDGQLTIIAAGDTTRFTANQATNDTVRLDKFATKEALKDTAKTLRGIICDSATACITKALADPTSEINYAIDTIARHNIHDTAVAIRNSIGNGTLTIQKNGSTVGTFTANQVADQTVDIAVPTKLSQLTNDGGVYAKRDSVNVFTNVNNFTSTVTVPSNTTTIPRPTTAAHPCTDNTANAVNICDLLAVFDSLTNKMNNILKTIDTLKHVNDSLAQEIASLKPTLTVTGPNENQHLCGGSNTITFTASITNANAGDYTYSWTVNGAAQSSTDTILYYTPAATGGYKVICTATRSGFTPLKDSASVNVSEGGYMPKFGICIEGRTVTVKSTDNNLTTSVIWGDGAKSDVVTAGDSHEYANGNYTIIASSTAFGNCKLSWPISINETTPSPCTVTIPHTNTSIYTNTTGGLETVVDGKVVSVRDQEGNTYYVTQIGNQCWMRTNLRTSKYNDGTTIPGGENCSSYSTTDPYHYINSSYDPSYGYFYNWPAACHKNNNNKLNLCPKGWHVPSQEEWATLFSEAGVTTPKNTGSGAVYLAGGCGWEEVTPGTSSTTPNSYENQERDKWGFTALPTGRCWLNNTTDLTFEEYGRGVYFWSSTEADADDAYDWYLGAGYPGAENDGLEKLHGRAVRCLRDSDGSDAPYLSLTASPDDESVLICSSYPPSTSEVHTVTYTATIENDNVENYTFEWIAGGNIEEETGTTLTRSWGEGTHMVVCVATKGNVVLKDTVTVSVTVGIVPDIEVVNTSTALTIRMDYEPIEVDSVSWGDNTGEKVPKNLGNVYHTYETGGDYNVTAYSSVGCTSDTTVTVVDCASGFVCGACKVNDADGHSYSTVTIAGQCWMAENLRSESYDGTTNTTIEGKYCPGGNSSNVNTYGYLYTWSAVMNGASSSSSTPSGVRGVCPEGWHVPSASEITALENVSVGDTLPGKYNGSTSTYSGFGQTASYWSATEDDNENAWGYTKVSLNGNNQPLNAMKTEALSVRCVKNAGGSTAQTDPSVSTSEATVSSNTATLKGTVNNPDNVEISNKGFGWKLPTAPDYIEVTEGISFSNSMMTFDLENLAAGTYSYYAFISFGSTTVYGDTLPFTIEGADPSPCTTIPTFTTCENDFTRTVTIKTQSNVNVFDWGGDGTLDEDMGVYTYSYSADGIYTITATSSEGCSISKIVSVGKATLHPCTVSAHNYIGDGEETVDNEGRVTTVKDYDGNVYSVAQIGSQCWLAENMRCTHSPSTGNSIVIQEGVSEWDDKAATSCVSKAAHWYYNKAGHRLGILYNWCAAVDTFMLGKPEVASFTIYDANDPNYEDPTQVAWYANFDATVDRRGICPKGWHMPSYVEFKTMASSIVGEPYETDAQLFNWGTGSGKFAKGCDWEESTDNEPIPGNYNYTDRNSSGFGALPVGYFVYDEYYGYSSFWGGREQSTFWTATENPYLEHGDLRSCNVWRFQLDYEGEDSEWDDWDGYYSGFYLRSDRKKDYGYSVRCVRDIEGGSAYTPPTGSISTEILSNDRKIRVHVTNLNFYEPGVGTVSVYYKDAQSLNPYTIYNSSNNITGDSFNIDIDLGDSNIQDCSVKVILGNGTSNEYTFDSLHVP